MIEDGDAVDDSGAGDGGSGATDDGDGAEDDADLEARLPGGLSQ